MDNVMSLFAWSKKFSRNDRFKKHHAHCVAIQSYDNLYKRQLKTGDAFQKISG